MEFRFRVGLAALEAVCVPIACAMLSLFLWRAVAPPVLLTLVAAATGLVLLLLILLRWRSRIVMDRDGIERRRTRSDVVVRLDWDQIDEIFLLGPEEFEVRGAGKTVRVGTAYAVAANARRVVSTRLSGLRDRLRDRALVDGQLDFRMPVGRWQAHVSYLIAVLFLSATTALILAPFLLHQRFGFPFLIVLIGGSWIWSLRRRASRLGTRVTLYKDGLLVRRLDGKDRLAWSDIASTEWDGKGGLVLVRRSGNPVSIPPTLANISILDEFVEEGRQASSAPS